MRTIEPGACRSHCPAAGDASSARSSAIGSSGWSASNPISPWRHAGRPQSLARDHRRTSCRRRDRRRYPPSGLVPWLAASASRSTRCCLRVRRESCPATCAGALAGYQCRDSAIIKPRCSLGENIFSPGITKHPQRDSNPCRHLERVEKDERDRFRKY